MRRLPLLLLIAFAAVAAFAADKKKKPGPEVLVVADVLVTPPEAARPTKEKPIHYIILGGGERTLGDSIAGEKMPKREEITRELVSALGSQGFRLTQLGGPVPQLAIVFTYGSANLSTVDLDDTDPTTGETTTSTITFNHREIMALVGADKASRRLLMSSEADRINEAAREDRLYVFVAALDVEALAKRKEKKLVWRTRISIESRRQSLPDSLHVMLKTAAPFFGAATELPVFVDDADRRKAEVQIGTPVVVPDQPAPKAPPPAAPKK
ncbi:MAG: hypothetical protein JNK23_23815 [Opitutaceae bacterium]|nr:hypothetical protein [Opitutaceae bacterium]